MMDTILKGTQVNTPKGTGEVMIVVGDTVVVEHPTGIMNTFALSEVSSSGQTLVGAEPADVTEARAEHASHIVDKLNHSTENNDYQNNTLPLPKQQLTMEITEKSIDVINDLIEINNDRVEGFEKAIADLEDKDAHLLSVFDKFAQQSRQYADELTAIVTQYGGEAAEGTSTSGALHRAWLDVKSVFTGGDIESILNECERGEDAIKAAYESAIDPENEISPELLQVLQTQQQGIIEGHNTIKALRDEAEVADDTEDEVDEYASATPTSAAYQDEAVGTQPAYGQTETSYTQPAAYAPEPESFDQEEAWEDEQTNTAGNSKLMEFFVEELKDLLWAEKELVDTLPDMAEAATSPELKTAFTNHLAETENHVSRLEQIFGILGLEPDTTKCDAMAGIVDEGDNIISFTEEGTAQRDVGLIFAGQKAEHYEIASYGGMISLAKTLGFLDIAEILVQTIEEEKAADALLTEIAENHVNYEASTEPGE